jgi:hypothetical protein
MPLKNLRSIVLLYLYFTTEHGYQRKKDLQWVLMEKHIFMLHDNIVTIRVA